MTRHHPEDRFGPHHEFCQFRFASPGFRQEASGGSCLFCMPTNRDFGEIDRAIR